ncbi:hypothetical protein [Krasilnikovia sp. MM14-A1004]|uniref:hypothetical protein n=1 Tax=Krasilnikovia sp. MM14-A1004 TaxID=3373541 RepID=UPI00399D0D51
MHGDRPGDRSIALHGGVLSGLPIAVPACLPVHLASGLVVRLVGGLVVRLASGLVVQAGGLLGGLPGVRWPGGCRLQWRRAVRCHSGRWRGDLRGRGLCGG